MGFEGQDFEGIEGVSPSFVESLYRQFAANPASVAPEWQRWFDGLEESVSGPSWQNKTWPPQTTDSLTAALDPTQMAVEAKAQAAKPGKAAVSAADIASAAADSIRAMMLIRTYRVRGHLAANLDPLGLSKRELPADLTPEYHGFTGADLDKPVYMGGALGLETATVRDLVDILRANYCGNVGLEYMHISDVEERRFLQDRMEGRDKAIARA